MKIFDEEEALHKARECSSVLTFTQESKLHIQSCDFDNSFIQGVEYAESKVEDLCIEFATFIENHFITAISSGKKYINFHEEDDLDFTSDPNRYSLEEVFQQFLTQRNGK